MNFLQIHKRILKTVLLSSRIAMAMVRSAPKQEEINLLWKNLVFAKFGLPSVNMLTETVNEEKILENSVRPS